MIKVKMLSALAYTDNSTVQPGQIIDLDDEKAKNLIKNNLAMFLCNIVEETKQIQIPEQEQPLEKLEENIENSKEDIKPEEKPKSTRGRRKKSEE